MAVQSLDGALAGHQGSDGEAHKRHHGQAAVLHLLERHVGGVHACGVEGEAIHEAGHAGLLPALVALQLEEAHDEGLEGDEGVVGHPVLLRAGLEPLGLAQQLGEQDAGAGGHGPAAVGLLSLRVPLQALGVGAQAQGIEAKVAGKLAVEVLGGAGSCEGWIAW